MQLLACLLELCYCMLDPLSLSWSQNVVTGWSQLLLRAASLKILKFPPSTELIWQPISNRLPQTCNSLIPNRLPQTSNSPPQTSNGPPQMSNSLPQTYNSPPQTYNHPPQMPNSLTPNSSHLEKNQVCLNNQWLLQTKNCRQININHPQLVQGKRTNKKICSVLTSQTLGA